MMWNTTVNPEQTGRVRPAGLVNIQVPGAVRDSISKDKMGATDGLVLKAPANKSEDLRTIPSTHIVKEQNPLP